METSPLTSKLHKLRQALRRLLLTITLCIYGVSAAYQRHMKTFSPQNKRKICIFQKKAVTLRRFNR